MKTAKNNIRLGQRLYGVTSDGIIIPTLVSRVELSESNKNDSNFVNCGSEMLNGKLHENDSILGIQFRALNHRLNQVWLTFDEACDKALSVLDGIKNDDSVSVRDQKAYKLRWERLSSDKEAVREIVDAVETFSESETMFTGIFNRDEKVKRHSQSDFPKHYHEPGTPIWIADTKAWQLIQGFVTEVHYTPRWQRGFNYCCGSHSNLRADSVFRTKKGALNYLARKFEEKLPGTLDRRRVPIIQQVSTAEKHEQMGEFFRKMSERRGSVAAV